MTRIFSVALLGMAICFPASVASVSGGATKDCDGKSTTLVCEEANGTMCNDIGNSYKSTNDNPGVIATSAAWSCKTENNNNDCSGDAKKTSNRCNTP
ncbi:hypothetical protein [Gimesia aquarii]|uniref:Uncharacterized protein n=1 Tax=Gimesia aquarii TaxID=2527964 RepID=A0A517VZY0_9PLAN|nr:hypothetical protein [Gimesia aquarii]QDT98563.1 hypothetical protein V144x_40700 [Gimesia aquarii]